jgi:hypothetical protein
LPVSSIGFVSVCLLPGLATVGGGGAVAAAGAAVLAAAGAGFSAGFSAAGAGAFSAGAGDGFVSSDTWNLRYRYFKKFKNANVAIQMQKKRLSFRRKLFHYQAMN